MNMLDPVIQYASDEHERLYYHHISEEEEQRLSRLAELIPLISKFEPLPPIVEVICGLMNGIDRI
ncbi:hypothetical protein ACFWDG_21580 [Peribacillus sp. NPDC060186]